MKKNPDALKTKGKKTNGYWGGEGWEGKKHTLPWRFLVVKLRLEKKQTTRKGNENKFDGYHKRSLRLKRKSRVGRGVL